MLDREISPVWHDRFARLIVRNLPHLPEVLALDIHCGTGRGTGELLHRLGAGAKVLAIDPDEGALELAKTRIRPEWKNRVYFKSGHFDDITAMADDSYNLVVANLVLGESVDLEPAIGEMIRVGKIGGRILATVPLHGTWEEVEDIFAEILRDAGMTGALRRLEALRAIRPTGPQLGQMLRNLGAVEDDYVVEHERFQLLFPSGREFLFAPVIEHGPLQMWKAVIGKDGAPQELFWRLKEAIDAYYSGHVLAVTVNAGLVHVEVAKGTARPGPRLAARFWRHYPELDKLWGGLAVGYTRVSDPILPFSDADVSDFDLDIDLDESDPRRRTGAMRALRTGKQPVVETPSPEDFGLRFRPRDPSESSGTSPLDSENSTSGLRLRPPGSEASGLRTLSQLRDSEISSIRPATSFRPQPLPVDEDDFSDLNTDSHQAVPSASSSVSSASQPAPAASQPAPSARQPHADDEDISRLAEAEDDFSELNEIPLLPRRRSSSESSASRPVPTNLEPDGESSAHRALAELALRPGDPVPTSSPRPSSTSQAAAASGRRPIADPEASTSGRRPLSDSGTHPAAASSSSGRRPIPDLDAAASGRRPISGPTGDAAASGRRPISGPADAAASGRHPFGDSETSGRLAADAATSGRRPISGPAGLSVDDAEADGPPPDAATSGRRSLADAETSGQRPLSGPAASGTRPQLEADAPAELGERPSGPARRPAAPPEAPKPSLPSFRLPEPKSATSGTTFRPPTFKPPGQDPTPSVDELDEEEPEEIDELEPVEELDEEPVVAAPRPPPPRVPPPPRPPSFSPDKKK